MENFFTAEELVDNYEKFRKLINQTFTGERLEALNKMYDHFEERIIYTPASSFEHFHNAFPGGYIDHILRVVRNTLKVYELWKDLDMLGNVEISRETLIFTALHHDLGKLGGMNEDLYLKNDSDWHIKNQGKIYKMNGNLHYMDYHERTIWLLNQFGVKLTEEEYLGIRLTDGLYDKTAEDYLKQFDKDKQLKTQLPYILHQADLMASKYEYIRWSTQLTPVKSTRNANGRPSGDKKLQSAFIGSEGTFDTNSMFDAFKDIVED